MLKRFLKLIPKEGLEQNKNLIFYKKSNYYFSMESNKIHKIGVAIDIDGTIILKNKIIPGAKEALEKLIQLNIPYLLLTNNISRS